jgi:3',5'-cyclic-AMP phosphodiesterase
MVALHFVAMSISRRHFLSLAAATGAVAAAPSSLLAAPAQDFSFIFLTDTHLQPELHGVDGCAMAFKKARALHADFAIQGGDHIFDALAVPHSKSTQLFHLYDETQQQLGLKTYHTVGNHDVVGLYPPSGMNPGDADYGKAYFEQHIGPLYQSWDHKGVHFIILDSIGYTPERSYYGLIDPKQMDWLKADLAKVPVGTPIIVTTHIPMISSYGQYMKPPATPPKYVSLTVSNAYEVWPLFVGHNVLGVLQGHTHVNERVEWRGVSYITSGAVSGNWWEGTHWGTPEGFTVCTVRDGKLTTRYETYGFKADHQKTVDA